MTAHLIDRVRGAAAVKPASQCSEATVCQVARAIHEGRLLTEEYADQVRYLLRHAEATGQALGHAVDVTLGLQSPESPRRCGAPGPAGHSWPPVQQCVF